MSLTHNLSSYLCDVVWFVMVLSVYRSILKETISWFCWVCVQEMIKEEKVTPVPGWTDAAFLRSPLIYLALSSDVLF